MEEFMCPQNQPFFLDPAAYISDSPTEMSLIALQVQAGEEMSNASSSCFTAYNSLESMQEASTGTLDHAMPPLNKLQASLDKKRKQSDGSCLSCGQSKGVDQESKSRKKKASDALKPNIKGEELKAAKATNEEPPLGYIHVRARRGQATDSHSLAERVRRERISERMKKLQELVPGCDNVVGKALLLDEIINYVQSLQSQVEFLSMKLASICPIVYDFGEGFEDCSMSQAEEMGSISHSVPYLIQDSHIPPISFEIETTSLQQALDAGAPFPLQGQGLYNFPQLYFSNASEAQQHVLFPIEAGKRASQTFGVL